VVESGVAVNLDLDYNCLFRFREVDVRSNCGRSNISVRIYLGLYNG
jgi:hypothetical protein